MLYFQTKPNKNGNIKQLIVDVENKTIQSGSFLFNPCFKDYIKLDSKKELNNLHGQLIDLGFQPLIKL